MYWDKSDKTFLEKIYQNVAARKSKKFRRNMFINWYETSFEIFKVKKNYLESFGALDELPLKCVYLIEGKNKFSTMLFRCNTDIVGTDWKGNITGLLQNVEPNTMINNFDKKTKRFWIMRNNSINFLKIENNSIIKTHK